MLTNNILFLFTVPTFHLRKFGTLSMWVYQLIRQRKKNQMFGIFNNIRLLYLCRSSRDSYHNSYIWGQLFASYSSGFYIRPNRKRRKLRSVPGERVLSFSYEPLFRDLSFLITGELLADRFTDRLNLWNNIDIAFRNILSLCSLVGFSVYKLGVDNCWKWIQRHF